MQKLYTRILFGCLLVCAGFAAQAQVSVSATVGTTGPTSYTTLKGAFDAINAGTHKGVITVTLSGNTTETASAVLNASAGTASYTAINITASAPAVVTLAVAAATINLNGATNVTIDGASNLQIVNTSVNGSAVSFNNDASNNTIKNTTLKGATNILDANSNITSGIVAFKTGATTGNDNNTLDNCDIDGTGTASCAIYSTSTAAQPTGFNSGDVVRNCRIHDFISNSILASAGLFLDGGSTGWTIQGNSFYFTNPVTFATQQFLVRGILIVPDFTSDAHTVTGNFVGGNAPNASGTMSLTGTGNGVPGFIGIDVETAGSGNVVQNNIVRNVTVSYANAAGSFGNSGMFGFIGGFDGTTTYSGNTVSNLSFTNTAGFISLQGIHLNARVGAAGLIEPTFTVTGNTVTNITCNAGGAQGDVQIVGIRLETSSGASLTSGATAHPLFTVTGNTVSNLTSPFTGTTNGSVIRGIATVNTQGGSGTTLSTAQLFPKVDISNNNINGFSAGFSFGSYAAGVCTGIHFGGSTGGNNTVDVQRIAQNTIFNLSGTNSGDVGAVVVGISATTGMHDISRNKIYDLKNAASGATATNPPGIVGIMERAAVGASTIANNFISLGNGQTTNLQIFGILQNIPNTGPVNVYYNTVYITGAGAAGNNKTTAGLLRGTETLGNTVTTPMDIKNNIFYNVRTGGGSHYAIGNTFTTVPNGWTSNYNNLYSSTAGTVALWGTASNTLSAYQTNSAGDANSKSVTVSFVLPLIGDLHLTGASTTDVNLRGTPITGITNDFDNDTRSTTTPTMGADEPVACTTPAITTQPTAQAACIGGSVTLSVVATGSNVSYQWRKAGTPIANANGSSFTIASVAAGDLASYDVVITNSCGTVTSNAVTLTQSTSTSITTQPTAQTACPNGNASFTVVAAGSNLTYQWRRNGTNIGGATSATYSLANVTAANAGNYDVVVTGTCGSVTSNAVALTVNTAPAITTQPTAQQGCVNGTATFSVAATGTGLTYQWRKDGNNIAGATNATYTINPIAAASAGNYSVVVTGTCGSVTSNAVALTITTCTAVQEVDADITASVLMPNVVRSNTVLRVQARKAMKVEWAVTDAQGRVVMKISQQLNAGQNDLTLQLGRLAAGSYYVVGSTKNGRTAVLPLYKK